MHAVRLHFGLLFLSESNRETRLSLGKIQIHIHVCTTVRVLLFSIDISANRFLFFCSAYSTRTPQYTTVRSLFIEKNPTLRLRHNTLRTFQRTEVSSVLSLALLIVSRVVFRAPYPFVLARFQTLIYASL